jgi:hypothetical protein
MEKVYLIIEIKKGPEHVLHYYEVVKASISYDKICEAIIEERDKLITFHNKYYQHYDGSDFECLCNLKRWSDKTIAVYSSSNNWKDWESEWLKCGDSTVPFLTVIEVELL